MIINYHPVEISTAAHFMSDVTICFLSAMDSKTLKQRQCEICNKVLASVASLYSHRRVHTKEKPYACHVCGRSFSQKSSLNTHLILHSGIKNFRCMYCNKEFALKFYKVAHEKVCKFKGLPPPPPPPPRAFNINRRSKDTKPKPFICHLCGGCYAQKSSLNTHLILHSGLKNHSCQWCHKKFALRSYQRTHEKTCKYRVETPTTMSNTTETCTQLRPCKKTEIKKELIYPADCIRAVGGNPADMKDINIHEIEQVISSLYS